MKTRSFNRDAEQALLMELSDQVQPWWNGIDVQNWISQKCSAYLAEAMDAFKGKEPDPLDEQLRRPVVRCPHPKSYQDGLCVICVRCGETMVNLGAEAQWEREGRQ